MRGILTLLLLLFCFEYTFSQVYEIDQYNTQTIITCKGNFVDAGGTNGTYSNNSNQTITFCSGGGPLRINFLWIDIETGSDFLYVYDGPSSASPLIATLTGTANSPGAYTSTDTCLTFKFTSDNTVKWDGWSAMLGCMPAACGNNTVASDECGSTPVICNINGYCGNTSGWYTRDNGQIEATIYGGSGVFCSGIQNNSWLSFIASSSTASFDIISSECTDPSVGVQAIILSTTDCSSFSAVSNCVNQSLGMGTSTLNATGLIPGTKYYIMVDGFGGNDCKYDITAQSGVQTINITPSNISACPGQNVSFDVAVSGPGPFTYFWSPAPLSGQNTSSAVYSVSTTMIYSVTVGGACGASQIATYSYTPNTPNVTVSSNTTICNGSSTTLTATGSSSASNTLTFSNLSDIAIPDNNLTGISSNISVSGLNGNVGNQLINVTLNINHSYIGDLDIYLRCPDGTLLMLTTDNGGMGNNYTNTVFTPAAVNIIDDPAIFAPYTGNFLPEEPFSNLSNCSINGTWTLLVADDEGGSTGTLLDWSITFDNTLNNTFIYTWSPSSGLSATTGTSVTASPTVTTTYTVTGTDASGCSAIDSVKITIIPIPNMTGLSSDTICSGSSVNFNLTSDTTATYIWYAISNNNVNGESTSNQTSSTINDILTLSGVTPITVLYSVTPKSGTCVGPTDTIHIVVNPGDIPIFNQVTGICAGDQLNSLPTTSTNGITGTWSPSVMNNLDTTTYTFTANNSGCISNVQMTINVTPIPTIRSMSDTILCKGTSSIINFGVSPNSATVNWTNNEPLIGLPASGSGNINSFTAQNPGNNSLIATIQATPSLNGCIGISQTFSITINTSPILDPITSQTVCAGQNTSSIDFVSNPNNSLISWSNSNSSIGLASSGTNDIPSFITVNSGNTIQQSTINAYAISNACSSNVVTFTITVNPIPTIQAINDQNFCGGSLTSAINFNVQPSSSVISWSNSNLAIGLNQTNGNTSNIPSFNATTTNTAISSLITINASIGTCNAVPITFNIVINSAPNITVNSNSPICINSTINLFANGGINYSWQGPNGFLSTLQNPSISNASSNMSGNYTVTVNGATASCSGTATVNIVMNPLPVVSAISNSPVCNGSSINLSANVNSNIINSLWAGPNNYYSPLFSPIITNATINMSGTYTLTVMNTDSCINASTVSVSVLPQPLPPITNSVRLCQNSQANNLVAIPDANGTLNWYSSSTGGMPSLVAPTPNTNNIGIYQYYVSQTLQGCESNRASLNVTILPLPVGSINNIIPKCEPLCDNFIFTASTEITQYQWNMGNNLVTSNSNTISHCYPFAGLYTISVKITDTSGCFNNLQFPNWVNVYENPVADFITSTSQATLVDPQIFFIDQSIGDSIVSYNWNFGDLSSMNSLSSSISHTYSGLGTFTVSLIVRTNKGCADTSKKIIEVIEDFNVYIPNSFSPNDDQLNEEFYPQGTGISEEKFQMQIFNKWGELIFSSNNLNEHWKGLSSDGINPMMQDTYIYKIDLQTVKGIKINKVGQVNLIR